MKLLFQTKGKDLIYERISTNNSAIFNFLNAYSVFLFKNNEIFRESIIKKQNFNFPDGISISLFYFFKKFKILRRTAGPNFIVEFLNNKKHIFGKNHFFIGLNKSDLRILSKKFKYLKIKNLYSYNPPYIKDTVFSKIEREKIIKLINKQKIDYVWVGVGNPKQEILSNQIFGKIKTKYIFNVGAAFDFITGKKKRAPKFIQNFGLEWLYRLLSDFKYTIPKVKNSVLAIFFMDKYVDFNQG